VNVIKGGLFGLIGGFVYAFISFYLLTPAMRTDTILSLIPWGIQGLIFGVAYVSLKLIIKKKKLEGVTLSGHIIVGAVSGLFSAVYSAFVTLYNFMINVSGFISAEVKTSISSALLLFLIGSMFLGLIVGFVIGFSELKRNQ
jgi:hypothetical protein